MATAEQTQLETKRQYPWWVHLIDGILAVALGTLLLVVPEVTIIVLVQFLGMYLFIKGILALVAIFTNPAKWGLKLIIGLLGIAAGYLILDHPFTSTLATQMLWIYLIAGLAIMIGLIILVQAVTGAGWIAAIMGIIAIFLGVLIIWQPAISFLALAYALGILLVLGGIIALAGSLSMFLNRGTSTGITQGEMVETKASIIDVAEPTEVSEEVEEDVEQEEQEELPVILLAETTYSSQEGEDGDTRPTMVPEEISWAYDGEGEEVDAGESVPDKDGDEADSAAAAEVTEPEAGEQGSPEEGESSQAETVVVAAETVEESGDGSDEPELTGGAAGEEPADETDTETVETIDTEPGDQKESGDIVETDQVQDTESTSTGEVADQEDETSSDQVLESLEEGEPQPVPEIPSLDLGEAEKRLVAHKVQQMEGIGPVYAQKLGEIGIVSAYDLLNRGSVRKGRVEIAEKTGISQKLVLKWVNQADLHRVSGIGSEYGELLEVSGVDTVVELATRKPENLHKAMVTTNEEKKLVRQVPSLSQVEDWVKQAKELQRIIRY